MKTKKLKPSNDPDNCPACKWHKRNRKNGIKMLGPLAYDVQDKCDNHKSNK